MIATRWLLILQQKNCKTNNNNMKVMFHKHFSALDINFAINIHAYKVIQIHNILI